MSRRVVVIAGTPGVGKSTVAERVAEALGYKHVSLSRLAIERGLVTHYDEERETYVVDEGGLVREVLSFLEEHGKLVIDTHYPEILPRELVDVVIVLRLNPLALESRLRERNWSSRKVRENVLAEMLSVVTINSIERFGEDRVCEIDVTDKSVDEVVREVVEVVEAPGKCAPGLAIDWLSVLPPDQVVKYGY